MRTVKDFVHTGNSWGGKFELDKSRCAFSVHETGRAVHFYQCQRVVKEKIEGVGFCTQHAKEVKRRLGIKADVTTTRFAAKFEDGEPTLLKLYVVSETDAMIDVQEIEEIIGDSMMGFMTGNQRKNSTYTKHFKLFDKKNDAISFLMGKAAERIDRLRDETIGARKTYDELTVLWHKN